MNCANTESTLVVHHLYYEKEKEPWDYSNEALIVLCEDCHKEEKENSYVSERAFILAFKKLGFLSSNFASVASIMFESKLNLNPFEKWQFVIFMEGLFFDPEFRKLVVASWQEIYFKDCPTEEIKEETGNSNA